jgi:hypothetical protein
LLPNLRYCCATIGNPVAQHWVPSAGTLDPIFAQLRFPTVGVGSCDGRTHPFQPVMCSSLALEQGWPTRPALGAAP